jgi:hypothetical protein
MPQQSAWHYRLQLQGGAALKPLFDDPANLPSPIGAAQKAKVAAAEEAAAAAAQASSAAASVAAGE